MQSETKFMPPGSENWNPVNVLTAWLAGKVAMMTWWPPPGRWSEGYGAGTKQLDFVPASKIAGKVGYAPFPGHGAFFGGYSLAVSSDSKNKEAAYLYMQWQASKRESLKNVMKPFGLRDPFRFTHYDDPTYQALWPTAKDYLAVLRDGASAGLTNGFGRCFDFGGAIDANHARSMLCEKNGGGAADAAGGARNERGFAFETFHGDSEF